MLGDDQYAIDMRWISRVELGVSLVPVPCVPHFVVGVTLLSERVVTVVDLHEFLALRQSHVEPKAQIILDVHGQLISFLSDSIPGFITLENPIEPVAAEEVSILVGVSRLGQSVVNLLDAEKLTILLTSAMGARDILTSGPAKARHGEQLEDGLVVAPKSAAGGCSRCKDAGFFIVHKSRLFTTMLTALEEITIQNPSAYHPAFNTKALERAVIAGLDSADPHSALRERLVPEIGEDAFDVLIKLLEQNHVELCPDCKP